MRKERQREARPTYSGFSFTAYTTTSAKEIIEKLKSKCLYVVVGLEICPTTKKEHLQGYFYLKEPRTHGMAKRLLKDVHIEPSRSGPIDNFIYCTKEENFLAEGSIIRANKEWELSEFLAGRDLKPPLLERKR